MIKYKYTATLVVHRNRNGDMEKTTHQLRLSDSEVDPTVGVREMPNGKISPLEFQRMISFELRDTELLNTYAVAKVDIARIEVDILNIEFNKAEVKPKEVEIGELSNPTELVEEEASKPPTTD